VGESSPVQVDVRVIAATNQDLRKAIQEKRFREDLFYRLNVVPIRIPPLRERLVDVPLLAAHFLARYNQRAATKKVLAPAALAALTGHGWPGNVRELENMIEQAAALSPGDEIGPEVIQFDPVTLPPVEPGPGKARTLGAAVEETERLCIQGALQRCQGDLGQVASELGISATTLWRKMKRLDLGAR
jgi:two-component system response regulator HydG